MQTIHNIIHRARASSSSRSNSILPTQTQTPAQPSSCSSSASSSPSPSSNEDINLKNPVKVVCRLRPRLPTESPADRSVVEVLNQTEIRITEPFKNLVNRFDFSACYDKQSTQQDIYDGQVHELVTKIFDGVTTTIFAFGCTGSGKTHTLQGSSSDPGIAPRAFRTIFEQVEVLKSNPSSNSGSYQISISCFEIWKDKVWDLLAEGGTATTRDVGRGDLPIREAANGQIFIPNLRHVSITSISQFDKLYGQLMRTRSVSTTKLNHASSRSHALLTLYLKQQTPQGTVTQGKCVLVDLAGSENNKKTGNEANKERMKESVEINQSLLALRKVVRSLNTGDHRIPYRDSKLTRILSDCLGGTSAALVICNVAPGASQYRDTMNTLTFGSHTRNVENKPVPKWSDSANQKTQSLSSSFYKHNHSKSTPNLHAKSSPIAALSSVTTTPSRTPLKMNWSLQPTVDAMLKPRPSLLPISPKVAISRSRNLQWRNDRSPSLAPSPSLTESMEVAKKVRFRASYSNLLDQSNKQRTNSKRSTAASERPTLGELDKRMEEVMKKTLDQLVQTRVDALLNARLQETGLNPSSSGTGPGIATSEGIQGTNKNDEDDQLSKRIATLEEQFQREYQQFTSNCNKFFKAQINYNQNPRTEILIISVH